MRYSLFFLGSYQKKLICDKLEGEFMGKMIFFLTGTEVFYAVETIDFSRNFENYADLNGIWEKM